MRITRMQPGRHGRSERGLLALLAALGLTLVATAAASAATVVTMKGYAAPGTPARYDRVRVVKVGPKTAKKVLVLVPGTSAGAGYFVPDAESLVQQLPGWQVWAVDRRENLLEDHSALDRALSGKLSPQGLFDYYLNWIGNPAVTTHYQAPSDEATGFARRWGMRVAIEDLHRVVRAARKGGRRVVLGGHSLGGSITTAYATWDFGGRAGARDLAGIVLIDGASGGTAPLTAQDARAKLQDLDKGSPFLDLVGAGLPWSAGVFAAVGSTLAVKAPDAPSLMQTWKLLPAGLKSPVTVTNRAGFGYALDTKTGPKNLTLVQAHVGELAATGDPRGWTNSGYASVERTARSMSGIPGIDGTSWFHPKRLSLDAGAVAGGVGNPAQKLLGLHATHGTDVHLPIYAFATSLGNTRVLQAARELAKRSHVPARDVKLVDRIAKDAHCDPIFDDPSTNDFLKTVVPFLQRIR
jgi:pimeloyl-ACP methyl ester carboxylesterase